MINDIINESNCLTCREAVRSKSKITEDEDFVFLMQEVRKMFDEIKKQNEEIIKLLKEEL